MCGLALAPEPLSLKNDAAGFLTLFFPGGAFPPVLLIGSDKWISPGILNITVAGTVPDSHRIPSMRPPKVAASPYRTQNYLFFYKGLFFKVVFLY